MVVLSAATPSSGDSDIIKLKLMMMLEAFNVLVCDQSCSTADIRVQGTKKFPPPRSYLFLIRLWHCCSLTRSVFVPAGLNGSLLMQGAQTRISAALKDVVVLDVDPQSVHKKVSKQDTSAFHLTHSSSYTRLLFFRFYIFPPF